ncbi:UxaA family hydrolase [Paraferrimonas sp. SM1919]|uniref:UxaA family hydrolase n=1 Tax=Paraferrimonas sp. SM1919 TaxID=2662263 RepID=UPI0013D81D2F|nr:UxaA family hydrolase [Paraferrimonas sp. SM1919]
MSNKLVLINSSDNVLICCQSIDEKETVGLGDATYTFSTSIDIGHKIAKKAISKGEKIIRYGVPIGSATADIAMGEHVHIHNMKSDYIPSHTRESKVEQ